MSNKSTSQIPAIFPTQRPFRLYDDPEIRQCLSLVLIPSLKGFRVTVVKQRKWTCTVILLL